MEYVLCSTCLTIASTGPHHTVDAGRNRYVGGGWRNAVGGFGGGDFLCLRYLAESGFHWWDSE